VFISDISHLGVRLPVEQLLAALNPDFSVIDGAQALRQRHVDLTKLRCDLYLTGTQKWFAAFQPLRTVFVGREENVSFIRNSARPRCANGPFDELFQFHEEVKRSSFPPVGTTVNVSPLICASGALEQAEQQAQRHHDYWEVLRTNAETFSYWMADSRWPPVRLHPSMSSGIVRLTPLQRLPNHIRRELRHALAQQGVVATAYDDGSLRFSMPRSVLSLQQLTAVRRALSRILHSRRRPLVQYRSTASSGGVQTTSQNTASGIDRESSDAGVDSAELRYTLK
jgi:selenocysteine lyase/cysteine desulfurase